MISDTHPTLSELEYVRSETLAEASQFLGQHPDEARPFLGGTDVLVRMRGGFLMPKFLVDIKNLDDTKACAVGGVWGGRLARVQPVNRGT